MITGTHNHLDERLDDYLTAANVTSLLGKVLVRYQTDYERDRPGLVGEALGLIWASRRGLTEIELLRLLKPLDKQQLPIAIWNPLRAALEQSLIDQGGILSFCHDFFREAVASMLMLDQVRIDSFRIQLVDFFKAEKITDRTCDELPWLLRQTMNRERLRECLLNIERFLKISDRDMYELHSYWIWLNEEQTMGDDYLASFEEWSRTKRLQDDHVADAACILANFLHSAAFLVQAELLDRRALTIFEKKYGRNHPPS